MTELRVDEISSSWAIVAPDRAHLPHADDERSCPFCPGHEAATPPELARTDDASGQWVVRVVANKYPLTGTHEIVVESPGHHWDMTGTQQVRRVLAMWRDRYRLHCATSEAVVVFRNHNPAAGTSQAHPHSQVVALPTAPPGLARLTLPVAAHEEMLRRERTAGIRIVTETRRHTALVAYAGAAYETWILPRSTPGGFGDITDDETDDLATLLPSVLHALRFARGDPPYNLMIHSGRCADTATHRWYLRIVPRIGVPGGLELATGIHVSTVTPEAAAADLRQHLPPANPTA
jgi:UDPglucose--hexose-1-phosphate uridylyltransferase